MSSAGAARTPSAVRSKARRATSSLRFSARRRERRERVPVPRQTAAPAACADEPNRGAGADASPTALVGVRACLLARCLGLIEHQTDQSGALLRTHAVPRNDPQVLLAQPTCH